MPTKEELNLLYRSWPTDKLQHELKYKRIDYTGEAIAAMQSQAISRGLREDDIRPIGEVNLSNKKKTGMFSSIASAEDAKTMIKKSAYGFWVVAAIQALVGYFYFPSMLIDAALYAALAAILFGWKSRIAAILLAALSLVAIGTTISNKMGYTSGGSNVVLALLFAFYSLRCVEAAFKLHGKFADKSGP